MYYLTFSMTFLSEPLLFTPPPPPSKKKLEATMLLTNSYINL